MTRFLPPEPSLERLRNEAKGLLKSHRSGDPSVCPLLRRLHRFRDAADATILAAEVKLAEVQFALAMDHGFGSWPELRSVVESHYPSPERRPGAEGAAWVLPHAPGGVPDEDRQVAAFSMALSYLEAPADPVTVAGDSGAAFILQADALHRPHGADVPNLDVGWWPLDTWGIESRLGFLGVVSGVGIRRLPVDYDLLKSDPTGHYRRLHEKETEACLRAGRPVVAHCGVDVGVVFGRDDGDPPLLMQPACEPDQRLMRVSHHPYAVYVFDVPGAAMDRSLADAEAITHALALGRDEIDADRWPGKSSGRRSWALWVAQLVDERLCGPHFYHGNVVRHLRLHRRAAVSYLRSMRGRHGETAGMALDDAASCYEAVLAQLAEADCGREALGLETGRRRLAGLIGRLAEEELAAARCLDEALRHMR